jgi:hypothetical protein
LHHIQFLLLCGERQEFNSTNQISGFSRSRNLKNFPIFAFMAIQISMPENLFDLEQVKFIRQKSVLAKMQIQYKDEVERQKDLGIQDLERLKHIKQRIAIQNGKLKEIKNFIDAYWDYTLLRALDPQRFTFNYRLFLDESSKLLGIERQEIMRKKRRMAKYGFAFIQGKQLIFISKDKVWEKYGVLVSKHKKDENRKRIAHQRLGVYKEAGVKTVNVKKGDTNTHTGEEYKKNKKFKFVKKLDVKVLKFKVKANQLNKTDLKRQAMLAFCKLNLDRENARHSSDSLREKEQEALVVDLTSDYLARKVGYVSAVSGWSGRLELEDTGFITVKKNKVVVSQNIKYEDAKEQYNLQQGVDSDTGYAYYYDKRNETVFGVKCYGVSVNGYNPINFRKPKQNAVKNDQKPRWKKWWEDALKACDGLPIKKIFGRENYLFEISSINEFLYELLEKNETFLYSNFEIWNSKKGEVFATHN